MGNSTNKINAFNNEGHLNELGIASYVSAYKSETLHQLDDSIINHLEDCEICKKEALELFDIEKIIELEEKAEKSSLYSFRYAIAATILLALIGVFYLFTEFKQTDDKPSQNTINTNNNSEEIIQDDKVVGDIVSNNKGENVEFKTSPFYENLLNQNLRASTISNVFPKNGASVKKGDFLSWQSQTEKEWIVKIYNYKEFKVAEYHSNENRVKLSKPLSPGIYYWRLEDENELLYLGKFVVK